MGRDSNGKGTALHRGGISTKMRQVVCLLLFFSFVVRPDDTDPPASGNPQPTNTPLDEDVWKNLVSVLFTGVDISDGNEETLFQGPVLEILLDKSRYERRKPQTREKVRTNLKSGRRYFPRFTACLTWLDNYKPDIRFSDKNGHAEQKAIAAYPNARSLYLNFSPCRKECIPKLTEDYRDRPQNSRPIINFFWVHDCINDEECKRDLRELMRTFQVVTWPIEDLISFLLHTAPRNLRNKFRQAVSASLFALHERNKRTKNLILVVLLEELDGENEDEENSYEDDDDDDDGQRHDRRRDDDDHQDGPGGAASTGTGGSGDGDGDGGGVNTGGHDNGVVAGGGGGPSDTASKILFEDFKNFYSELDLADLALVLVIGGTAVLTGTAVLVLTYIIASLLSKNVSTSIN